ncbi:hypothetical protein [Pseudoalteromonas sp. T1lg75]|uniref:hypothetical protein n=1 Tax=Pseudoalteromonas sp. T1lg75 TaxID=2077102 RepID=UPI000CF64806|nr:hypothetical protein [Pseudoalteromonas sp. T1lg75]
MSKIKLVILISFFSFSFSGMATEILDSDEFRKQWRAIPTIEALEATVTPQGEFMAKSSQLVTANLTFTITPEGKAKNVEVLSVTPDKPGYKEAFKRYYELIQFKPLVDNPTAPAKVQDSTFFGGEVAN